MLELLAREAPTHGLRLTDVQLDLFTQYHNILLEWSQRMNLVGDTTSEVVQRRHFLESIAFGAAMRERQLFQPDSRMLDLGAGAGFPGIPIKIVWPSLDVVLLEATAKKASFLQAVLDALKLQGISVRTGRAEEVAREPDMRESFNLVVARAVAPLPTLVELALPFLRVGGRLATAKGSRADGEIHDATPALAAIGGKAFAIPFSVSGPPQKLVIVLKQRPTPDAYPRRSGIPAKSPLK